MVHVCWIFFGNGCFCSYFSVSALYCLHLSFLYKSSHFMRDICLEVLLYFHLKDSLLWRVYGFFTHSAIWSWVVNGNIYVIIRAYIIDRVSYDEADVFICRICMCFAFSLYSNLLFASVTFYCSSSGFWIEITCYNEIVSGFDILHLNLHYFIESIKSIWVFLTTFYCCA